MQNDLIYAYDIIEKTLPILKKTNQSWDWSIQNYNAYAAESLSNIAHDLPERAEFLKEAQKKHEYLQTYFNVKTSFQFKTW